MNDLRSDSKLTRLDGLICAYLVLPLLLFCTWFKWPVAIAFIALLGQGFHNALRNSWHRGAGVKAWLVAVITAIALLWTALSGVGHFAFANLDWVTRDAVLRDLTETAWPPQYATDGKFALILRAPVGFYLPAAALGSVLSLQAADLFLYLWTALGFGLFLCAVTTLFSTNRQRGVACVLMLAFGGLDLIGARLLEHAWPAPGQHIEWWAEFAQYSSNSTLMFWVPNHALPAWLGLTVALRLWRSPDLARITPLLAAAIPLWSPLSALGLAPFFIAGLNWRRDVRLVFSLRYSWPLIAIGLLVARYITMDTQSLPHGQSVDYFGNSSIFWSVYLAFCFLEFGLLALVLFGLRVFDLKLGIALVILVVLPFFRFGPGTICDALFDSCARRARSGDGSAARRQRSDLLARSAGRRAGHRGAGRRTGARTGTDAPPLVTHGADLGAGLANQHAAGQLRRRIDAPRPRNADAHADPGAAVSAGYRPSR